MDFMNRKHILLDEIQDPVNFLVDPLFNDPRSIHSFVIKVPYFNFRAEHHPANNANLFIAGFQVI